MPGTKKHILKILGWIFLSLILLISVTGLLVYYKAENYLDKNLSNIISKQSNQLYNLHFKNINLKLAPLSVSVSDIDFLPNDTIAKKMAEESPDKVIYSIQTPLLTFNNIKLIPLLKKRILHCKTITVSQPVIEISGEEIIQNDSIHTWDNFFFELKPLFRNFLNEITVDEIDIQDANYGFYNYTRSGGRISNARQISITVKNFRTDSAIINGNDRLFDSEDVIVRMKDFSNNMGDSLHVLTIDSLEYSLKNSNINAQGFRLKYSTVNPQKSLYDVYVPSLTMKSKSITRFALNDSVKIEFLKFVKPEIKFYQKENPKRLKIEDINEFDLYSLIENQLTKIDVDSFILSDASIEIYRQPDLKDFQQQFKSVDINLSGFTLDSTSSTNKEKLFDADNIEMTISGYHLRLEDNEHDFLADSMFLPIQICWE